MSAARPGLPLGLLLALSLPAAAVAQDALRDASTRLHEAWLREILDLDTAAAARGYEAVAADPRVAAAEYWVATARLAELDRLGLPVQRSPRAEPPPAGALRNALTAAPTSVPLRQLVDQLAETPEETLVAIAARTLAVPDVRPFTHLALEWARSQIDPGQLQWLQRMRQRDRTPPQANDRVNALDVLRAETAGNRAQADMLRSIYFPSWKAPAWRDAAATLPRVRERLDAWSADPETSAQQRSVLRALREAIDQRAEKDPEEALTFVARLPIYADRLLADVATEPAKPEQRPNNR